MTSTTLPAAEHRHVGGSAGGPGENSAKCACGTVFDGFDTHREAVKLVEQHIRDEQGKKRADQLAVGDWIAAGRYSDRIDGIDDAEVLHVHMYAHPHRPESGTLVAALIQEHTIPEPVVIYLHADQRIPLLSAAEVADIQQARRRDQMVAQLRGIADLISMNELRIPGQWGAVLHIDFNADAEAVAEVAKALRVDLLTPGTQVEAVWPPDSSYVEQVLVSWSARTPKVPAVPVGMDYSRELDDPTPVSPARPAAHVGDAVSHINEATGRREDTEVPVPVAERQLVDVTPALAWDTPASGLTVEADLSRGPLAGTTPVVTYFSFGHGQTDPDTGQKLIDHYVTVVAPTYDECRTAMFASRYGNKWSWDYLAGRAKTTEAVSQWTEHEVIVAEGLDPAVAEAALKAAAALLVSETR
jgi:hypothetical protein